MTEEESASTAAGGLARWSRRRRRANVPGGRVASHRVMVTPEEEAQLVARAEAQRVSVPRLLVEAALADAGGSTPTERSEAMALLFAVRRELAGVAGNVNQLARAANVAALEGGSGPSGGYLAAVVEETRALAGRIDAAIDGLSDAGPRRVPAHA